MVNNEQWLKFKKEKCPSCSGKIFNFFTDIYEDEDGYSTYEKLWQCEDCKLIINENNLQNELQIIKKKDQ